MNSLALLLTGLQASPQTPIDFVGIAGILGTLLGTALGAFVTWKIQNLQLAHEDKTRYHERKLAIYADFTQAANEIVAIIAAGNEIILRPKKLEATRREIESFELIRLVASKDVWKVTATIHEQLAKVMKAEQSGSQPDLNDFNKSVANFVMEARKEIGIDKLG